jgi:subtilase family serine protease
MKHPFATLAARWALLSLLVTPALAAERQILHACVPAAVAALNLQPVDRLPGTNRLHIAISLPLRNQALLLKLFREIYDPASTNFHRFLTPEQFTEKFGPSEQDYSAVMEFAKANGLAVTGPHPGRSIMGIDGSVAGIEKMLHVKMVEYQHPSEARRFFAPDGEPSLDLDVPVSAISGLNNYSVPLSDLKTNSFNSPHPNIGSGMSGWFLGADFRNAYVPGTTLTGAGQVVGLVEEGGGYNVNDLLLWEAAAGITNPPPIIPIYQNNLQLDPGTISAEFMVDMEMVISMAPGIKSLVLYEPRGIKTEPEMYQEMAYPTYGEPRPNQVSTSFATDMEGDATNSLMQLAMQGQSFFIYTGDHGAFPTFGNRIATSYVTYVGGTSLTMSGNGLSWSNEVVWQQGPEGGGASGGGIFNACPIPFYQQGINMSMNQGSTQWRNVPDVSMVSENIEVFYSSLPTNGPLQCCIVNGIGGTSCSAPLWAGFAALANQQAAATGHNPVGLINVAATSIGNGPLYTNCFHDITSGNSTNTNPVGTTNAYGNITIANDFQAAPGYDLCTGWGSPNGTNLINALLAFDSVVWVDFNYTGKAQNGTYDNPFATLAQGVSAVPVGGNILIRTTGSTPVTPFINKAMKIGAYGGTVTIGN